MCGIWYIPYIHVKLEDLDRLHTYKRIICIKCIPLIYNNIICIHRMYLYKGDVINYIVCLLRPITKHNDVEIISSRPNNVWFLIAKLETNLRICMHFIVLQRRFAIIIYVYTEFDCFLSGPSKYSDNSCNWNIQSKNYRSIYWLLYKYDYNDITKIRIVV